MYFKTIFLLVVFLFSNTYAKHKLFKEPIFNGIRDAHRLKSFIHKYTKEANLVSTVRLDSVLAELGPLTGSENSLVNSTARVLMQETLEEGRTSYEIGVTCLNHTKIFLEALLNGSLWALQMVDSIGKPPSNILGPNIMWVGSFEECRKIKADEWITPKEKTGPFNGMYCSAYFNVGDTLYRGGQCTYPCFPGVSFTSTPHNILSKPLAKRASLFGQQQPLTIGLCFPDSCSDYEASVLTNLTVNLLPLNSSSPFIYTTCKRELEYSSKAIAVIVVCSIFLAVMMVATIYDMVIVRKMLACLYTSDDEYEYIGSSKYGSFDGRTDPDQTPLLHAENGGPAKNGSVAHEKVNTSKGNQSNSYTPSLGGKILLSFSVYSNSLKILSTAQPAGALTAVNGIRFISMTWVILGHSYAFGLGFTDNFLQYLPEVLSRFSFQAISNATVAVDTFFVLRFGINSLALRLLGTSQCPFADNIDHDQTAQNVQSDL